jgi:hypothetical protein
MSTIGDGRDHIAAEVFLCVFDDRGISPVRH